MSRASEALLVAFGGVLAAGPAAAREPTKSACLAAYEAGQRARLDRDLLRARAELAGCSRGCPDIVQSDCSDWLREVEREIPTLVLSARWSDGTDITAATVWIDGERAARRLDGKPIAVNPGEHRIAIEVDGRRSEQVVVANQSERDRVVRFVLERPGEAAPSEPAPAESGGAGPWPWVLGGVALAAVGGFAYFALKGTGDLRELRDTCAPNCSEESLDGVKQKLLIADILLGVGVVSGAGATYLLVTSDSGADSSARGAFVSVGGRF